MQTLKVHRIMEGPFEDPEEQTIWITALIESNGHIYKDEIVGYDWNDFYDMAKWLATRLEPYEVVAYWTLGEDEID